ncbi:MAG: hypothetical protein KF708_05205 [Pirellulales bacterium]|nr:hypothetical protein [Pirellulales bacterium]
MAAVELVRVASRDDLERFIHLPWTLYPHDSLWVPPLKSEMRRLLTPGRHPFWEFAERELFLAVRGGKAVGRIAAIVDRKYNDFHREQMGIWGFFECAQDSAAAEALFSAAVQWTRSKGMTFLRGPLNPSTNYEVGMLLEGFHLPPMIMMPWNPPYYLELVAENGFVKEKDLHSMLLTHEALASTRIEKLATRIRRNNNVTLRKGVRNQFDRELAIIREIYLESWSNNWGFVPMSEAEFDEMGKQLRRLLEPDFVLFVYYEDDPAGMVVILPDFNPLLKKLNGKIGLTGIFKYLYYSRRLTGLRGILFGIKQKYQRLGLPALYFEHLNTYLRDQQQYREFELGWNLEDNENINQFEFAVGANIYKKYRIFRKALDG